VTDEFRGDSNSDAESEGLEPTHPRFRARRAEVEDQSLRSRNRKLIAGGAMILALLLLAASTQSALLDVDEVRVVGAERAEPDYLREVAAIEIGAPILGLDTDTAEERLSALPEIASAAATASWNGTVTIEINERTPVARIESIEGTVVVAADGVVLLVIAPPAAPGRDDSGDVTASGDASAGNQELQQSLRAARLEKLPADIAALPELAGAMFTTEPGDRVPEVLADALMVAAQLPNDIATVTDRVEITVDSLELRVVGGGAISLGDARDLDAKFDAVRAFLAEVDLSCLETLNVRAPTVPVIERNSGCS